MMALFFQYLFAQLVLNGSSSVLLPYLLQKCHLLNPTPFDLIRQILRFRSKTYILMTKTITALKYSIREFYLSWHQRSKGLNGKLGTSTWMPPLRRKKTWFHTPFHSRHPLTLDEAALPGGKNLRHVKPLIFEESDIII